MLEAVRPAASLDWVHEFRRMESRLSRSHAIPVSANSDSMHRHDSEVAARCALAVLAESQYLVGPLQCDMKAV